MTLGFANHTTLPPIPKPRTSRGFALVATISVMVLLVMVALAMLSLATVQSRDGRVSSAKHEARMNARLALMEAIARLQRSAGPDQRISATADMAGKADGTSVSSGAAPLNNSSHAGLSKGLTSIQPGTRRWTGIWENRHTNPGVEILTHTPTAKHLDWLVSGDSPLPSSSVAAVNGSGQVADPTRAVVLVGSNTVGAANQNTLPNYVAAPLVSVGSGGKTTGRYAWWIGDEGVKARINQPASYAQNAVAKYEDIYSGRLGWESVPGFADYPKPGKDLPLAKAVTDRSMELAAPALRGNPLEFTFHAATPYSLGLVTNPLTGGLKTDLYRYLEDGFPTSLANQNIIPQSFAAGMKGPKWQQLRSFYQVGKNLASNGELQVQAGSSSTNGITIAPVIADLRVLFGAKSKNYSGTVYQVFPAGKVAVSIANPYSYPLRWDQPLVFELKSDTPAGLRPSCIWDLGNICKYLPENTATPAVFHNAMMHIPAGVLPPGEARAYTIDRQYVRPFNTATLDVNLIPFENADASNFEHSIIQENPYGWNVGGGSLRLDVRESTNTTQLMVELRLPGSGSTGGLLRKIQSFELDNGHFRNVTRWLSHNWGQHMKLAYPLQLYEFQLSQPGNDYGSILPHPTYLGLNGSTCRTFADFNIKAEHFKAPITSYNPPPYFGQSMNSFALLPNIAPGGNTGTAFTKNLAISPLPWGYSPHGPEKTILFSFPKKLLSLGQLQHADLTADDDRTSVAHQPGNAFGNSYASSLIKRHLTRQTRADYKMFSTVSAQATNKNYYDISYLLNAVVWDNYFLSTLGSSSGTNEPLNPSLTPVFQTSTAALTDPLRAASQLGIRGAFNVNSTSKEAWMAVLSSSRHLRHPADTKPSTGGAFFARSLEQSAASNTPPNLDEEDSWAGYRRLTENEVELLAEHIVQQVRKRGPFTSLAHFINRTITPLTQQPELSRSGPLQAAIDLAGLTVTPDRSSSAFAGINLTEDRVNFQHIGNYPRGDIDGSRPTTLSNGGAEPVWAPRSADLHPGAVASILAERSVLTDSQYENEQGSRSTGIPGWLTQADVLQTIGSSIAVRSDTFRVRAYGESVDPATGKVRARAWCEAIIQRTPEYVDPANPPETKTTNLNPTNTTYGRKFVITSFRWLAANEI